MVLRGSTNDVRKRYLRTKITNTVYFPAQACGLQLHSENCWIRLIASHKEAPVAVLDHAIFPRCRLGSQYNITLGGKLRSADHIDTRVPDFCVFSSLELKTKTTWISRGWKYLILSQNNPKTTAQNSCFCFLYAWEKIHTLLREAHRTILKAIICKLDNNWSGWLIG